MDDRDVSNPEWNSLVSLYYRELLRNSREPSLSPRREGFPGRPREPYKDWKKQNETLGSLAERKAEEESVQRRYQLGSSHRQRQHNSQPSDCGPTSSFSPQQRIHPSPILSTSNPSLNPQENDSGLGEEHHSASNQLGNRAERQFPSKNVAKKTTSERNNSSPRDDGFTGFVENGCFSSKTPYNRDVFQEDDSGRIDWDDNPRDGTMKPQKRAVFSCDTVSPERRTTEKITYDQARTFNGVINDSDRPRRRNDKVTYMERAVTNHVNENVRTERSNSCGLNMEGCGEKRSLKTNCDSDRCGEMNCEALRSPVEPRRNYCEEVRRRSEEGSLEGVSRSHGERDGEKLCHDLKERDRGSVATREACAHHPQDRCAHSWQGVYTGSHKAHHAYRQVLPEEITDSEHVRTDFTEQRRFAREERIQFDCPGTCRDDLRPMNGARQMRETRCFGKEACPHDRVRDFEDNCHFDQPRRNIGYKEPEEAFSCCCGGPQNSVQGLYRIVCLQSRQMSLLEKQVSHLVDFLSSHDLGHPSSSTKQTCDAATMTSPSNECFKCSNSASSGESLPDKASPLVPSRHASYSNEEHHSPKRGEEERDESLSQLQEIVVESRDEPSPPASLHIDVPDYTESSETEESDTTEDDEPPIGWTFYNNITGQVNRMLKGKERKRTKVRLDNFTEDDLLALEELRYLQMSAPEALPKRFLAGRTTGEDRTVMRTETDTSIKINSLAAKYLQHAPQGSKPVTRHIPVCNIRSGTNMSIATMQYLQRYQLITDGVPAAKAKPARRNKVRHREPVPSRILDVTAIKNLPKLLPKKKP